MREIARESGCHVPSIYYHFTSKDNLYREACAHKLEDTIDIINSRVGDIADPRARIGELTEAFFELFTGDRVLMLLMQRDVADAGAQGRRFLSRRQYDHFLRTDPEGGFGRRRQGCRPGYGVRDRRADLRLLRALHCRARNSDARSAGI